MKTITPDEFKAMTKKRKPSKLEETFAAWVGGIPFKCVREYRFNPPRRWRFDFAFPAEMVAVELEGGAWVRGRHVRPQGFLNDIDKYNVATLMGWRVLRFTSEHLKDMPEVVDKVNELLKARSR